MKITTFVFKVVSVAALCAGLWIFASLPSSLPFKQQGNHDRQSDLLKSALTEVSEHDFVESEIVALLHDHEPIIPNEASCPMEQFDGDPYSSVLSEPLLNPPVCEPLNQADFPDGITPIGLLTIDSINLRLPVMEGIDEQKLRIAPGHIPQTATIGEIGNAVIAGHRNYTFGSMFNRLGEVENGDIIGFQTMNGETMMFEVFEILVIMPDNQIAFIQPQNEAIITLYTCTPIKEATHRLLIRARIIGGGL